MKTCTRRGVFETNSSSSHSISIDTSDYFTSMLQVRNGKVVSFGGEFGWEEMRYTDAKTKLDYCVTFLFGNVAVRDKNWDIDKEATAAAFEEIKNSKKYNMLKSVIFEYCNAVLAVRDNGEYDFGYIDHQSDYVCEEVFTDENTLANFIFNPKSVLITDNDNH